ncbi:MAG: substrate-binding domain-containing protein [Micrococcales bacterium]
MSRSSKVKGSLLAATLLLISPALTACDPPMPPELIAQLAEQTVACESGDVTVSYDANLSDVFAGWADSLMTACPDPAMTISTATDLASANLVISSNQACEPFIDVPVAYDAAVLAFQLDGYETAAISPANLAKILSGEITNWSDPQLAEDNPDSALPDLPIQIRQTADAASVTAISDFLKANSLGLKANFDLQNLTDPNSIEPLAEGEIAILPASVATAAALATFGISTGAVDADGFQIVASASADGIYSASTQLVFETNGSKITATLDPSIEPKSIFEGETAATPYQLIFPIHLLACGEDNLLTRAAATYLLRLDSQGSLTGFNLGQVPEQLRLAAVGIAREGLPLPTAAPEQ